MFCTFFCFFLFTSRTLSTPLYLGLHEGQICSEEGSTAWVCKKAPLCPELGDIRESPHYICGFQGTQPIVCCPPSHHSLTETRNRFIQLPTIMEQNERPKWPVFTTKKQETETFIRRHTTPRSTTYSLKSKLVVSPHPDVIPFSSFKKPTWSSYERTTSAPYKPDITPRPYSPLTKLENTTPLTTTDAIRETPYTERETKIPSLSVSNYSGLILPATFEEQTNNPSDVMEESTQILEETLPPNTDSFTLVNSSTQTLVLTEATAVTSLPTELPLTTDSTSGGENAEATNNRIAVARCREYNTCNPPPPPGVVEISVVGGYNAGGKAHPHMALIGAGPEENKIWVCGGSLISEKFVLTAAHCSAGGNAGAPQWVRLGELDISTEEDDAEPQDFRIVRRINHPLYQSPSAYNDVALYELERNATLTDWVRPICLHAEPQINEDFATVTGWGRIDFVGPTSERLQEVSVPILADDECARLYPPSGSTLIPSGLNATVMICAGEKEGGKDACTGDSGGPLVIRERSCRQFVLAGVISFGQQCALPDKPGIYTRVGQYIDWIESVVWP